MAVIVSEYDTEVVRPAGRFKVRFKCNQCGEKFILRGSYDRNGNIDTGFKMCMCGNSDDVEMTRIEE